MSLLTPLDWMICGIYVAAAIAIGAYFSTRSVSQEDYFLGGRKMNWVVVGVSIFAGGFSSLSFVGIPRVAAYGDYHLYLALLLVPLFVTPILWLWFIPLYHKLQVLSAYEYLEYRFDRRIRRAGSVLYSLYTIGWSGTMLYAIGVVLELVLGLSQMQFAIAVAAIGAFATAYTMAGGVQAVIWTDVVQFFIIIVSVTLLMIAIGEKIPEGWTAVWEVGRAHDKFEMFDMRWDLSHTNFYAALAYGAFVLLAEFAVSQNSVQRYVTMPSVSAARRALVINALSLSAVSLAFFAIGTALFTFYHPAAGGLSGFPDIERQDHLLSYFILTQIPESGLMGLFLAGMFAAGMSSMDGAINSVTATLVSELKAAGRVVDLGFDRRATLLIGLLIVLTALLVGHLDSHVFNIIMKIAGTLLGPLLGIFLLGMMVPWSNAGGAAIGLAAGFATILCLLPTEISHWWYGAVGCIPTVVGGAIASWMLRRASPAVT